MNNVQLQRTLRLLRRTGDRGIVLDPESDEVFVLMDADSYEEMLPSAESPKKGDDSGLDDYLLDDLLDIEDGQEKSKQEQILPREILKNTEKKANDAKGLNFTDDWAAEKSRILSEESLSDVPHEEEEEEKFYLEPVE